MKAYISKGIPASKLSLDYEDAKKQVTKYVEYFNSERLHSALHYLTPEDFLLGRIAESENKLFGTQLLRSQ